MPPSMSTYGKPNDRYPPPHGGLYLVFDLDPSCSVLDHFKAVKGHVVGKSRVCGPCDRKIQAELPFDDGLSN